MVEVSVLGQVGETATSKWIASAAVGGPSRSRIPPSRNGPVAPAIIAPEVSIQFIASGVSVLPGAARRRPTCFTVRRQPVCTPAASRISRSGYAVVVCRWSRSPRRPSARSWDRPATPRERRHSPPARSGPTTAARSVHSSRRPTRRPPPPHLPSQTRAAVPLFPTTAKHTVEVRFRCRI